MQKCKCRHFFFLNIWWWTHTHIYKHITKLYHRIGGYRFESLNKCRKMRIWTFIIYETKKKNITKKSIKVLVGNVWIEIIKVENCICMKNMFAIVKWIRKQRIKLYMNNVRQSKVSSMAILIHFYKQLNVKMNRETER